LFSCGGVHRLLAAVNVADYALGVDHECGSFGDAQEAEHAVLPGDFLFRITQQGKSKAQLLREAAVGFSLVDADPQNLGAGLFEIGKTILVCRQFLRSTRRVRINKESQDDAALPPEITEPDQPAGGVRQLKIRRGVSEVQCHPGCPKSITRCAAISAPPGYFFSFSACRCAIRLQAS